MTDEQLQAALAELEVASAREPSRGIVNVIDIAKALIETRRELAEANRAIARLEDIVSIQRNRI